jgi:ATP sulfurylase
LTDRKAAVYKYLQTTYGVYENGCSEWDNVTLIREINVTHLAHEERRWMTVDTSDVIKEFWAEDERLSDFRDHIRDQSFVSRLRDHLDRLR